MDNLGPGPGVDNDSSEPALKPSCSGATCVDTDILPGIQAAMDTTKRKATISEVTIEARKVLESFLLRNPLEDGPGGSSKELVEEDPYMLLQSYDSFLRAHSGHAETEEEVLAQLVQSMQAVEALDEPDYAEPAEPEDDSEDQFEEIDEDEEESVEYGYNHPTVAKTYSEVSSQSSYGFSLRSAAGRSCSPSDKLLLSVHPPKIKSNPKGKIKKKTLFDSSSSSTEDYEYCDNELLRRKKKSFFKWASERLRQSFRRSKVPGAPGKQDDPGFLSEPGNIANLVIPSDDPDAVLKLKKKPKKNKLKFNLKRSGSQKSKSTHSSNSPSEVVLGAQGGTQLSEGEYVSLALPADDSSLLATQSQDERSSRKSPLVWKRHEVKAKKKDAGNGEGRREKEKGLFESFLKSFRKGSTKQKKGSKEDKDRRQRSRSADNLLIRPLSKSNEKLLMRYVDHGGGCQKEPEYDSDNRTIRSFHEAFSYRVDQGGCTQGGNKPPPVWYPSSPLPPTPDTVVDSPSPSQRGHHSLRRRMHLEGLAVPCDPSGTPNKTPASSVQNLDTDPPEAQGPDEVEQLVRRYKEQQRVLRNIKIKSESEDDLDGGTFKESFSPAPHLVEKPFHERTRAEKEELYEKIAEQLAAIADQYNLESPKSPKSSSSPLSHETSGPSISDLEPVVEAVQGARPKERGSGATCIPGRALERKLGALLKDRGEASSKNHNDPTPVIAELVRNASYSKFKQVINENVGSELGWEQIAMMFRLTQTSVQLAGMGTAVALQIKEMTLKYFEDKYASWIVGKGGWESMVEDTNTELDSELD